MMATKDKKSSPKAEKLDSENRKGSDSSNPEKLSSAGGLAKDVKKLDDLKKTDENKKAVAESEGKKVETKKESKPAVAKVKKGEKKEVKAELEREYVVPMRKGFMNVPHYRRAKKAVKTLKEFMVRHMNVRDGDTRKIKVDINLNNEIWFRGIKKPLHKIKVKAVKKDGLVYVTLADPAEYVKFNMARQEKRKLAGAAPEKAGKAATPTRQSVPLEGKKVEDKDKNKDGVDDAKEEKEDAKSEAEKDAKAAKVETKDLKHTAQGKHGKKTAPVRKTPVK